ncbi:hypothetical protein RDWZM_000756 [Blomia tropicalis]|uniref:Uncharacterized protein n=1 Tax=Blomia tropicalis TaxID=40697 RepID=A0A9Q0MAB6_BLOTA|nr:hypothetical protein BLOT_009586 [Blomia tropicalis]KAJ6222211.1 hypothetical protein RDWZM_000756 [Blomia tropicalis]
MPQIRLRKPKAILFDINGTATYTSFTDRFLANFARRAVKSFLSINFNNEQIQRDIAMIRIDAKSNQGWPQVAAEGQEAIIADVEAIMNHCLDNDVDCLGLAQLRFHIWFEAYQKGQITTSIYSDVAIQMKRWRCDYNIKLYVCSQGWSEANKVFLSRTNQGDMTLLIDGYFDTKHGSWKEPKSFHRLLEELQITQPSSVVLFTKNGATARSASHAGIVPIIVTTHKKCYDALSGEEKKMAIIRTMNEIEFE